VGGRFLQPREEQILEGVLRAFGETHRPVGSRTLADLLPGGLSPATIRAVLARLEEAGYLAKHHVSSGRIPTDRAYRLRADRALVEGAGRAGEEGCPASQSGGAGLEALVRKAAGELSSSEHSLGFATTPPAGEARLSACELFPVSPGRVLMVVASAGGQVREHWLAPGRAYSPEALRAFGDFITERYRGWTFAEIRDHLRRQVEEGSRDAEALARGALQLVAPYFLGELERPAVFWEGARWLLEDPEVQADLVSLRVLLEALEEREGLLRFLDEVWDQVSGTAVAVGEEWPVPGAPRLVLVASAYGDEATGVGFVGIIGTRCLAFERAIPRVRAAARRLTRASREFGGEGAEGV